VDIQPFEILRPDAAWCGPRILYFFSWYLGMECDLDDVVHRCATDKTGLTTLANLVEAAESIGLEPTPIRCSSNELRTLTGPAIVCVRNPRLKDGPVHFIGLIARSEDGRSAVIFDPSESLGLFIINEEALGRSFTGEVVLLKRCPRLVIMPSWSPNRWMLVAVFTLFAAVFGFVMVRKNHAWR